MSGRKASRKLCKKNTLKKTRGIAGQPQPHQNYVCTHTLRSPLVPRKNQNGGRRGRVIPGTTPFNPLPRPPSSKNPQKRLGGRQGGEPSQEHEAEQPPFTYRRDICRSTADSSWACFAAQRLADAFFSAWSTRCTTQHMRTVRPTHDRIRTKNHADRYLTAKGIGAPSKAKTANIDRKSQR